MSLGYLSRAGARVRLRFWCCSLIWLVSSANAQQVVPLSGPAAIWRASCGYCHEHGLGPVLFGRSLPAAATVAVVRNGARGMPAFHPAEISSKELSALAAWVSAQPAR
jgi:hypothetical protein